MEAVSYERLDATPNPENPLSPERLQEALVLAMKHNAELVEKLATERNKRYEAHKLLRKASGALCVDRVDACHKWMARCGRVLTPDGKKPIRLWRDDK